MSGTSLSPTNTNDRCIGQIDLFESQLSNCAAPRLFGPLSSFARTETRRETRQTKLMSRLCRRRAFWRGKANNKLDLSASANKRRTTNIYSKHLLPHDDLV